ncbi:MAG: hypothetical protein QG585_658 [Patescibacteria group bacterium]|jgi:NTP pyrophosphatase (non-canonical NTP hydrolase)|nr:hypothetical protein [Patescibacteria group bacterium]
MTFDEYQQKALLTDGTVGSSTISAKFISIVLGLSGEAGEIVEKFKKIYREKDGIWDNEDKKNIAKELGDLLWYISSVSNHTGISLEEIANINLEKLKSRSERGVLFGSGDNR